MVDTHGAVTWCNKLFVWLVLRKANAARKGAIGCRPIGCRRGKHRASPPCNCCPSQALRRRSVCQPLRSCVAPLPMEERRARERHQTRGNQHKTCEMQLPGMEIHLQTSDSNSDAKKTAHLLQRFPEIDMRVQASKVVERNQGPAFGAKLCETITVYFFGGISGVSPAESVRTPVSFVCASNTTPSCGLGRGVRRAGQPASGRRYKLWTKERGTKAPPP